MPPWFPGFSVGYNRTGYAHGLSLSMLAIVGKAASASQLVSSTSKGSFSLSRAPTGGAVARGSIHTLNATILTSWKGASVAGLSSFCPPEGSRHWGVVDFLRGAPNHVFWACRDILPSIGSTTRARGCSAVSMLLIYGQCAILMANYACVWKRFEPMYHSLDCMIRDLSPNTFPIRALPPSHNP